MASQWYFFKDDQQYGPVSSSQLKELAAEGHLQPEHLLWRDGMSEWIAAGQVKGLYTGAPPPPPAPAPAVADEEPSAELSAYADPAPQAYADHDAASFSPAEELAAFAEPAPTDGFAPSSYRGSAAARAAFGRVMVYRQGSFSMPYFIMLGGFALATISFFAMFHMSVPTFGVTTWEGLHTRVKFWQWGTILGQVVGWGAGTVTYYVLLYRCWTVIQALPARTTPDKAVWYSFIPFFNFYWAFAANHGLAVDMKRFCEARQIPTTIVPGLMLASVILMLIPCYNVVIGLVLFLIAFYQIQTTAAAIVQWHRDGARR